MTAPQWQSIETAPRDGAYVLVFPALHAVPLVAVWQRERGWLGHWRLPMTDGKATPYQPTHWMPLPDAPAAKA